MEIIKFERKYWYFRHMLKKFRQKNGYLKRERLTSTKYLDTITYKSLKGIFSSIGSEIYMLSAEEEKIKEEMLNEYLSSQLIYVEFTNYIENKVRNILIENGIKYQALSSRVKSYDSLKNKLTKGIIDGAHRNIRKLNDLSGVRVIFYDEKELKKFNDIIYSEFEIVSYNLPEDIMKYDGTNITVSLKKDINKFKDLLCEIQLTTLLSHAMNEFGHDILYKDNDELQSKNDKEYDKIKDVFEDARKDILKVVTKLEFISNRVQSIKTGAKDIEILLGEDFKERLQNVRSLIELEDIINAMIKVIPLINQDEDKYKGIYDSGIIYAIVKKFSDLPVETASILNYDTYEYKYCKLLEFLESYKYLWIDNFKEIISILYRMSYDNNIVDKFEKFVEDLMVSDKADSSRGYAYYNIHEIAYLTIIDNDIDEFIRLKLAEYFCDINYNYCEETGMNQISFVRNMVNPNTNYKNKIYNAIKEVLNIFFTSHSNKALNVLVNINYDLERNSSIFDYNPIYEFFDKHYDQIDIYSKNEIFKSVNHLKDSKLIESKFYKKMKKDKVQILFAMLFNYFISEVPNAKYTEREEFRHEYLDKYVEEFNESNINEILSILNVMDIKEIKDLNFPCAGSFLTRIGMLEKYGEEILGKKWNEFILLGIIERNKDYKYKIDNDVDANKIIQAMIQTGNRNLTMMDILIDYVEREKNEELEIQILRIIFCDVDLINNDKYKKYSLCKIKKYNSNKKGIMDKIMYNLKAAEKMIENYAYSDICTLLENFRYSDFNRVDEFFLKILFEKYPEIIRELLRQKVNDNPNVNLYNSYSHLNLTNCKNFKVERYNNLLLCLEILSKNNWYKVSNYIHYLIGNYNEELGEDILKYLKENDNYDSYSVAINLCRIFNVSISGWKIYEHIVSNVEQDDKILNEIECLLFNTGVVSGEDGIAKAFNKKYEFFKGLKPKEEKLKLFVKKEQLRFKNLYQDEKNKLDKNDIVRETRYKLEKGETLNQSSEENIEES